MSKKMKLKWSGDGGDGGRPKQERERRVSQFLSMLPSANNSYVKVLLMPLVHMIKIHNSKPSWVT
ncbi:hypothetical protein A2U01_0061378 [Trifolium medium]|uniref:Uncharacterized protein n=1 Tax=Trifolium medium TaxID=97028 RepID=A0A392RX43_9FABA|nr:hypothetical protein [Trifolium medium]